MAQQPELQQIGSSTVHQSLAKHMLVDGYDLVLDFEKSHGSYIYDKKHGKSYIDLFTFYASNPIGFNHPRIKSDPDFHERLLRVAKVKPSNSDIYSDEMAAFVEKFSEFGIPDYLPHLFMVAGGSLAVENAMKTAFDWKVRQNFRKGHRSEKGHQILHFRQAFHGRSGYALSVTNTLPDKTNYFPKFDWPRIINPKLTFPLTDENMKAVREQEQLAVNQIKQAIIDNPDDIAGILIEPIQGEGGDNHFSEEFMKSLRQLADENEILLIFDEVQTGFGLTGKFWAHEHFVAPDILAFGKKAQVCGILVGKRIDKEPENVFVKSSRINSTWGGNLVDMVRSTRYLEIIHEEELMQHANRAGKYILKHLNDLAIQHEHLVSNVRGRGLMCAFDLPNGQIRDRFTQQAWKNGIIILGCGTQSVRFRPALNIPMEVIDEAFEGLSVIMKNLI